MLVYWSTEKERNQETNSLLCTRPKGPVIMTWGVESNAFLRKIFSRPTQRAHKKEIVAHRTGRYNFSTPTLEVQK